jgi:BH0848 protein
MTQIVIIHGGDSFSSYDKYLKDLKNRQLDVDQLRPNKRWKDTVIAAFPGADILIPTMPNSANAQYDEWVIWFEKIIPYFSDDVRLIGHSLGAMFLAKYLHENPLKKPVHQLILLAAGYNDSTEDYGSFMITSAKGIEKSADEVHLLHSRDDFIVPYSELAKFEADIPTAHVHTFDNKNHFLDADFPELIALLKQK